MDEQRHRRMLERALIGATLSLLLAGGDLSSAQNQPSPTPITFAGIHFSGGFVGRPSNGSQSLANVYDVSC